MANAEARESPAASATIADGGRTPGDATALLVELGRLVKGRQFYPDRHPLLREIFERGFRAFEAELRRAGPLELEIRQGSFRLGKEPVGRGRVDDLAQDFVKRAVRLLRFDAALTPAALERFVATLAIECERLEQSGGFVKMLYAEACPGIRVNEMDYAAALAQAGAPRGLADFEPEGGPEIGVAGLAEGGSPEDESAGAARAGGPNGLAEALSLLGASEKPDSTMQQLEQAPLDAESQDDRAGALLSLLRELDGTTDHDRYLEIARSAAVLGAELSDDGLKDEGYRAILVLAEQASNRERPERLRQTALECLRELARGKRLDDLIERATAPGEGASLRAAQIVLRLGETAVPTLVRRVEVEQDLDRRGQLFGILIAMGDVTTPELCAAMQSGERRRAGVAVRLAGEMQNTGTVNDLTALLSDEDVDLRREAAKALVRVGTPPAIEALVDALQSTQDGVASHAAFCLGVAGGDRALAVLLATAERDGSTEEFDLAREAVRALARLGRSEAVPGLAKILDKKSFFRRKPLRELQLAAVATLSKLPGEDARATLERAVRRGDGEVREAARQALDRLASEPEDGTRAGSADA